LYAVVVDTAQNAKSVLTKGKLKRRVTIIPMDKMNNNQLRQNRMDAATNMFPGKVRTAISLVGYADELEGAMQHVFGSTLVCESLDIAKKVTFHNTVKLRSVTLEGDSVDPSGTMSGGSRGRSAPVLLQLASVADIRNRLRFAKQELDSLQQELNAMTSARSTYETKTEQLDLATHQLKILQDRVGNSKRGVLQGKVDEATQNIVDCETFLAAAKDMKKSTQADIKTLSKQLAELEKSREAKMGAAEKAIATHKKALHKATAKLRASEAACEQVKLELEQMKQETTTLASQILKKKEELNVQRTKVTALQSAVTERKGEYEAVANELRAQKEEMAKCEVEMKALMKFQSKLEKRLDTYNAEMKKTETKINRLETELQSLVAQQKHLVAEHRWIDTEKQFFGARGTDYDFSGRDLKQTMTQLKKLRDQSLNMEKSINRKVMGMIQKAETEYQGLMKKRKMLENDRLKIEEVIVKLDDQKKEALQKTWAKVTVDFGSIFSTLLPGTNAKLEKVSESVIDGLEVKVAFSGVWKASLSELSGGQRSLVALSLILALLRFKPAPMYILDEVDAALDLSHTQNIGIMLKTHFKNSQFVVVSLKEGMFNNANVIFRTQFIDGMSTVRRTIPAGAAVRDEKDIERMQGRGGKSGKSKRSRKGPLTASNR
jgi:structural maintenance of chromosome 2